MATLKDWKEALSTGVSVKSLLGLPEGQKKTRKCEKRKLTEDVSQPSISNEGQRSHSQHGGQDDESGQEFEEFVKNLKVTGFLEEPQHFKWASIPVSEIINSREGLDVHPPVPSIQLDHLLGPCFIGVQPTKPVETDESSSSDG